MIREGWRGVLPGLNEPAAALAVTGVGVSTPDKEEIPKMLREGLEAWGSCVLVGRAELSWGWNMRVHTLGDGGHMGEICHWPQGPSRVTKGSSPLELIALALSKPRIPPPTLPVWELA